MEFEKFEEIVLRVLRELPDEFRNKLDNIDVIISDQPSPEELHRMGLNHNKSLLGLYEGVPLTKRGWHYGMTLPDKITIYQKPIESRWHSDVEIAKEIKRVVCHEIAHYFGISDEVLSRIEHQEKNR